MKSTFYIVALFLANSLLVSCSKVLDKGNLNAVDVNEIWKDENLIRLSLNNIYANRPGFDNANPPIIDNICDETRIGASTGNPFNILAGIWTPSSAYFDYWAYADIRKANEFIAGVTTSKALKESLKKQYLGEARFLRAITYFDMVKRYGGVPIITTPQDINDDLKVKRNTVDECYQFIVKECDEAAAMLPAKGNTQTGRATSGAALALKSRALLFYASQLYNTGNDKTRWENAAVAAQAVMDLKAYSLHPDVRRIMLDKSNNEVIFEVQYSKPDREHGWDAQAKPLSIAIGIGPKRCPLQELVDAFPMQNGLGISQSGSGYNPADPYTGRDKRFYATIVYNGAEYCGRIQYSHVDDPDGIGKSFCTTTGYYQRKGVDETNKGYSAGKGSDQNWIEIRYAEILLNYAEARNEATGPDSSVSAVLNQLRTRAGITNPLGNGITQDSMRNLIRNERYVELCYEMKRYWDLRRWKIAERADVLNGRRYTGMKITKVGNGWKYERVIVDPKNSVFTPNMYYMPIPFSELIKNANLTQNPGW